MPARDALPIPDTPFVGTLPRDAKDPVAAFPAIEPLRPPADGLDEDAEDADHLISPEERLPVAVARQ